MRLAMLAPFALAPKGTTRWRVLPLARALGAGGHQVRVVVPPHDWPASAGRRWAEQGLEVLHVGQKPGGRLPSPGELILRLTRAVLDWQPDVVHVFKPIGYSGMVAGAMTLMCPDLPLVIDLDDWERAWHSRLGHTRALQWALRRQEDWLLDRASALTAASRWLVQEISASGKGSGDVSYLPNGMEPLEVGQGLRRNRGSPRLLLYTRFVEHTPLAVVAIWRQVLAQLPDAQLVVAGLGLQGQERELMALVRGWEIEHSVRLLGWVPEVSRAGVFAAVDAAMLPVADTALNRAKCPMRLVDLLAHGVPVAAHAVGEYGSYIRHEETGLLAQADDDGALAAAAVRLLREPRLGAHLGQAAAACMRSDYNWDRLAAVAVAAYDRATAGKSRPGWQPGADQV